MTRIEFRVLGALEVESDGRPVGLRGARNRALLAALLLDAGQVVPVGRLVDAVWDDDPPGTAHKAVRNGVWSLRSWLATLHTEPAGTALRAGPVDPALPAAATAPVPYFISTMSDSSATATPVVETDPSGYRLRLAGAGLDADRFRHQLVQARALAAAGEAAQAVACLRGGLALWRGPAFAGFTSRVLTAGAARMEELRLAALEQCLDLELALGRHRELVSELRGLVDEWPLREGMVGRLMLALYRSGRRADALAVFERFRDRLAADLGLDPTADLRRLHQMVLRADPEPGAAAPWGLRPRPQAPGPRAGSEAVLAGEDGRAAKAGTAPEVRAEASGGGTSGGSVSGTGCIGPQPSSFAAITVGGAVGPVVAGVANTPGAFEQVTAVDTAAVEPAAESVDAPRPQQPQAAEPSAAQSTAQSAAQSSASATTTAPAQLPRSASDFTARAPELAVLDALIGDPRSGRPAAPAVVTGAAGVGKSALAVQWAHLRHDWFPDGLLHADLGPHDGGPPPLPEDVLVSFLRSLGAQPERVPASDHGALFRSILDVRSVLIVLDGAVSADQVRPLLPGGPSGRVLVTSRDELRGLTAVDGARRLTLPRLTPAQGRELLSGLMGPERVAAEPGAAVVLAERCAGLPLALRIAAARLADTGFPSIRDLVEELGDPPRLEVLCFAEDAAAGVRAAFDASYRPLPAPVRALFRRLSLLPPHSFFTAADAAELLGVPARESDPLLDRLATVHLVERHPPGRYTLHSLLRSYAAERYAAEEDPH